MTPSLARRTAGVAAVAIIAAISSAPVLAAGSICVTLNGNALNLVPAPTERAGRVFVPLRGVFENMGATVVYANGLINATRHGQTVSLHIGSQQATVDGQPQTLDVAPFIIGASTYVPLRFISQALGAFVNWDGQNDVVAITMRDGGGREVGQAAVRRVSVITPAPRRDDDRMPAASPVIVRDHPAGARRVARRAAAADPRRLRGRRHRLELGARVPRRRGRDRRRDAFAARVHLSARIAAGARRSHGSRDGRRSFRRAVRTRVALRDQRLT